MKLSAQFLFTIVYASMLFSCKGIHIFSDTLVPEEWNRKVTRLSDTVAEQKRAACEFSEGSLPAETLGQAPTGKDIPIETIIVIMQENRSFDHYFAQMNRYTGRNDVDAPPQGAGNPSRTGSDPGLFVPFQYRQKMCNVDTNHERGGTLRQFNNGRNDGFVETNDGFHTEAFPNLDTSYKGAQRAMYYMDERDLPFYYELASTFSMADRFFCSFLGPTHPNRMFLYAARTFGRVANNGFPLGLHVYPRDPDGSVFDQLERRKVSWAMYSSSGLPGPGVLYAAATFDHWSREVSFNMDRFYSQAKAGTLPQVVFIDPEVIAVGDSDNEHPPATPQVGQKFVSDIVHAMFKSPQWKRSAIFVMWDEHGGFYDHVPPPPACATGDVPIPANEQPDAFSQYGFRVPFILVSPYAKKNHVSHRVYDHTSITRFIQAKHTLPALSGRDANAEPPYDMFDFTHPPFMTPPEISEATVDPVSLAECQQVFGSTH